MTNPIVPTPAPAAAFNGPLGAVSILSGPALEQAVKDALGASPIPPDHKGAFVLMADTTSARAVIAAKVNDVWQVEGIVEHPWSGGLTVGAEVKATW